MAGKMAAVAGDGPAGGAGPPSSLPPTLVVGLGNPILGDDAVGWRVADEVERRLEALGGTLPVTIERLAVGGIALMERLVGWERAIIIDCCVAEGEPGTVRVSPFAALGDRQHGHLDSAHDTSLGRALAAGRSIGASLPDDLIVVTIDAVPSERFDVALTAPVARAVDHAADAVMELLGV